MRLREPGGVRQGRPRRRQRVARAALVVPQRAGPPDGRARDFVRRLQGRPHGQRVALGDAGPPLRRRPRLFRAHVQAQVRRAEPQRQRPVAALRGQAAAGRVPRGRTRARRGPAAGLRARRHARAEIVDHLRGPRPLRPLPGRKRGPRRGRAVPRRPRARRRRQSLGPGGQRELLRRRALVGRRAAPLARGAAARDPAADEPRAHGALQVRPRRPVRRRRQGARHESEAQGHRQGPQHEGRGAHQEGPPAAAARRAGASRASGMALLGP
mmetsp:Transcript_33573/g.114026  ORF Transcript_33573/g.114026 Transcript_33573/m.114026 type:complete len:269 (+) Transcript_33573:195-1001(+)